MLLYLRLERYNLDHETDYRLQLLYPGFHLIVDSGRVMATVREDPLGFVFDEWRDNPLSFTEFFRRHYPN